MPPARNHVSSPSVASELAITPDRFRSHEEGVSQIPDHPQPDARISTSRAAGFVGMLTGCGALIALLLFLPLPKRFQDRGMDPAMALRHSFYIVAGIAFFLALWCFVGLRSLTSDVRVQQKDKSSKEGTIKQIKTAWHNIRLATASGFKRSDIALGYLGGFVARASSVGISLFIPLLVNALFLSSHLCKVESTTDTPAGLPDIKRKCPQAYVLAAEMTGICETVALIAAPIFGYTASKTSRKGLPMMVASAAGMFGYCLLPSQLQADGEDQGKRAAAFIAVSLIGVSQIGAIVCSLGVLSSGILASSQNHVITENTTNGEQEPLLESASADNSDEGSLSELKGAVAGIYSFYGGVAILILTKLGGALFDKVSVGAPFYIMAVFNAILFVACCTLGLRRATPTR
jgi:Major Facilitator Superfamily